MRNNYVKAKIDKMQQNSKCRLCGKRNEMINHIINECSKLQQKKSPVYDWVGKVIHWELCKKLKFDHPTKWYIRKRESRIRCKKFSGILRDKQIVTVRV